MVVRLFAGLLDERIAVAETDIGERQVDLFPEEETFVTHSVRRRRIEFAAGRACARRAIEALGYRSVPLPPEPDRVPHWPAHLVGSITHTDKRCAAAVARRQDGVRSIGIDLEPAEALPADLWTAILRPSELSWLDEQASAERGVLARAIFSAKECAFKCQYGITRTMLDFHELEIAIDRNQDAFVARFVRDVVPFHRHDSLPGRFRLSPDCIASAMTLGDKPFAS
jgi:4'-phosphopantetheinyl transferase EntD